MVSERLQGVASNDNVGLWEGHVDGYGGDGVDCCLVELGESCDVEESCDGADGGGFSSYCGTGVVLDTASNCDICDGEVGGWKVRDVCEGESQLLYR